MKNSLKFGLGLLCFGVVILFCTAFTLGRRNTQRIDPPPYLCVPTTNAVILGEFTFVKTVHIPPHHIKTPKPVKAIYMSSWVAGIPVWREKLFTLIRQTELNSIVIDVKDYSGTVSFETGTPKTKGMASEELRIRDIRKVIDRCHELGIYTIARITVFQDPEYAKQFPEMAVHSRSGKVWKDRNGLSYIDPSAKPFWDYIVSLAKKSEEVGFDEINFDYVRFPSDGNMEDMVFPLSGNISQQHELVKFSENVSVTQSVQAYPKARVLRSFFAYLSEKMKPLGVPISADLFGMVLTNQDDLNIGQILEVAAPYFDYICPMIYPSHYPPGFKGFANPAQHPYEIVHFVLSYGAKRLDKTPRTRYQIRPWLQDFNMGAVYDSKKIIAQKQGVYDAGLDSWMMWDARNRYTAGGYSSIRPPKVSTSNSKK